jgi:hypothetical protein
VVVGGLPSVEVCPGDGFVFLALRGVGGGFVCVLVGGGCLGVGFLAADYADCADSGCLSVGRADAFWMFVVIIIDLVFGRCAVRVFF